MLTLAQEEKAVFCVLTLLKLADTEVEASIEGIPAEGFDEDIKAVTYHQAEVHRKEGGEWETLLVLDI